MQAPGIQNEGLLDVGIAIHIQALHESSEARPHEQRQRFHSHYLQHIVIREAHCVVV